MTEKRLNANLPAKLVCPEKQKMHSLERYSVTALL